MDYKIEEYTIEDRLERLGLELPDELSFLPENLYIAEKKEEFIFTESIIELNKYFKTNNLELQIFGGDSELYRSRKNADIYLPALFFSLSLLAENPQLVSISLNVLSSYVYDSFKGIIGKKTAHVEFHIESREKGKVKKIDYKGDVEGLKDMDKIINAVK